MITHCRRSILLFLGLCERCTFLHRVHRVLRRVRRVLRRVLRRVHRMSHRVLHRMLRALGVYARPAGWCL